MKSEKKRILVIGASRGIGAEVAQHFAQQGDYRKVNQLLLNLKNF